MSQLIVRRIEPAVVRKLRNSAAVQGVSVEEAHRRLLRAALLGNRPEPARNFIEYLRTIPKTAAIEFPRTKETPRSVEL